MQIQSISEVHHQMSRSYVLVQDSIAQLSVEKEDHISRQLNELISFNLPSNQSTLPIRLEELPASELDDDVAYCCTSIQTLQALIRYGSFGLVYTILD